MPVITIRRRRHAGASLSTSEKAGSGAMVTSAATRPGELRMLEPELYAMLAAFYRVEPRAPLAATATAPTAALN